MNGCIRVMLRVSKSYHEGLLVVRLWRIFILSCDMLCVVLFDGDVGMAFSFFSFCVLLHLFYFHFVCLCVEMSGKLADLYHELHIYVHFKKAREIAQNIINLVICLHPATLILDTPSTEATIDPSRKTFLPLILLPTIQIDHFIRPTTLLRCILEILQRTLEYIVIVETALVSQQWKYTGSG